MELTAAERFALVHRLAASDPEYLELQHQCTRLDLPLLTVLEKLPEEDRMVILNYIRALGASALRLTEIACEAIA